jgi:phosphohistidine phosphatase
MSLEQAVDIDASGRFKYVLIRLYLKDNTSKLLVRGHAWGEYHDDIYQKTLESAMAAGLDTECLGGGRINHDPDKKEISVYGYSVGYGRADHCETVRLIKKKYPSYKVDWSNEGY